MRASEPVIGRWVPVVSLRLVFLTVAAGLSWLVLPAPFWLGVGISLAAAVVVAPKVVPTWWLLLGLSLGQIWREPSATDVVFYLLLAGVHLLHVLGGIVRLVPRDGRVQVVALFRPLRRYVFVQVVVQAAAFGVLRVFAGDAGTVPGLSIVAAVVLGVVAVVLVRGMRRARVRQAAQG